MEINYFDYAGGRFMYTGDAAAHDREVGVFEVRFFGRREKFDTLVKAYLRYLKEKDAISLWDITEGEQMAEAKVFDGPQQL